MAAKRGITLYHSPASRAFAAYWMLEELGVPFDVQTVDIRKGEQKAPAYLKLNPSGKVPTRLPMATGSRGQGTGSGSDRVPLYSERSTGWQGR